MLYEIRTYSCVPGTMQQQLDIYRRYGLDAQVQALGKPLLYATTEIGQIDTYTHVWTYEDQADRQRKRAAMYADPRWDEYRHRIAEHRNMRNMQNCLLNAVPGIPVRG